MKYLINLTYDGSKFFGYQIQKNKKTIEGELENVLSKVLNTNINAIASSRTDRKVHAFNQYATFETNKDLDLKKFTHSLNSLIDKSIYIKKVTKVNESFNVRNNVIEKEYIYVINLGEYNPIEKDYVFQYNKKINKYIIESFISKMNGEHNFTSFTSDKNNKKMVRKVKITYKIKNDKLYLTFVSNGFLRYMIRNIVGLLLEINEFKKSIDDIDKIFKSMDRTSLGICAKAEGLYLNNIIFKNVNNLGKCPKNL